MVMGSEMAHDTALLFTKRMSDIERCDWKIFPHANIIHPVSSISFQRIDFSPLQSAGIVRPSSPFGSGMPDLTACHFVSCSQLDAQTKLVESQISFSFADAGCGYVYHSRFARNNGSHPLQPGPCDPDLHARRNLQVDFRPKDLN
jgi:hypothetical protein